MPNYEFKQLSPHDFEQLARDVLQEREGIVLESFKSGRDLGIDFRHAKAKGSTIVQCKHYAGTGLAGLLVDLKKEALKVSKLKPSRYILVTSVGLTPSNKTTIQALFGSVLSSADILGVDDLNNLLGLFPNVEQRHYKLWLASRAVLDRVVHNASLVQSEFDAERIYRDVRRYVQSAAYPRAIEMLERDHVAIISGAPGVGKTSLAKMLLYAHLEQGFEPITILSDFQTGRERYQKGKKQVFYFDDFIGATFLGERSSAFTRNEDRAILDFIEMVRMSPTARLVMTTRQHILNQAIAASEKLKNSRIVDSRCVLEIHDYNLGQRAEILYNHIYFSDLPEDYRASLLTGRFYKEIVLHKKFNPRLIEWLATYRRVESVDVNGYQDFVRNLLADPQEIWRHAYEDQISEAARSTLLALYTFSGECGPAVLEKAFRGLHVLRAGRYGIQSDPSSWRRSLGPFLRPGSKISVLDPSVNDMLNAVIVRDPANALDMIEGAIRFEQARRVWRFAVSTDGSPILDYLIGEASRVASAFERLLSAPRKRQVEGGVVYFDDTIELRVATMIQVAGTLMVEEFIKTTVSALEALISSWESERVEISDGIALLSQVETSAQVFESSSDVICKKIVLALAVEVSTGCRSDELRELLDALDPEAVDQEVDGYLNTGAQVYLQHHFTEDLRSCRSLSEYESLEEDLGVIAERTNINFEGPIEAVLDAKTELEQNEAAYEDHKYEEWKDRRYEVQSNERALDDLFDSLRPSR
jgi:Restriction endonuclease